MKTILIFTLSILLLCSCAQNKNESAQKTGDSLKTDSEQQLVRQAAEKLVENYSKTLKKHLMSAMKEGGASKAVDVCSKMGPEISDQFSREFWQIKRVSEKQRRVENYANEHEILSIFKDSTKALTHYYDEWIGKDSAVVYYYYKPIRIGSFCLNCHGQTDEINQNVLEVIKEKYPEDMASGYKVGDLRGMFVVRAMWPEGKEDAIKYLSDSL